MTDLTSKRVMLDIPADYFRSATSRDYVGRQFQQAIARAFEEGRGSVVLKNGHIVSELRRLAKHYGGVCQATLEEAAVLLAEPGAPESTAAETPADVAQYLKEGETQAECIGRLWGETDSLMTLLAQARRENDYSELHRLIEDGWYKARRLLSPDDSPYHWLKDIQAEWVEIKAGRRAQKTGEDRVRCRCGWAGERYELFGELGKPNTPLRVCPRCRTYIDPLPDTRSREP